MKITLLLMMTTIFTVEPLAKETALFAALSPMSCGMVKGAHDPGEKTKPVSIMQVIGDQDNIQSESDDVFGSEANRCLANV